MIVGHHEALKNIGLNASITESMSLESNESQRGRLKMHVKETFKFEKGQGYDSVDFIGWLEDEFTEIEDDAGCTQKVVWGKDVKLTIQVTYKEKQREA
jgi:hypothetical protein